MKPEKPTQCACCKRDGKSVELTFHHLVPKKMQGKSWVKVLHPDKDLVHYGIWVCSDCHKQIHRIFNHNDLARFYYTRDKLMGHEKFRKFIRWVSKQKKAVKRR